MARNIADSKHEVVVKSAFFPEGISMLNTPWPVNMCPPAGHQLDSP